MANWNPNMVNAGWGDPPGVAAGMPTGTSWAEMVAANPAYQFTPEGRAQEAREHNQALDRTYGTGLVSADSRAYENPDAWRQVDTSAAQTGMMNTGYGMGYINAAPQTTPAPANQAALTSFGGASPYPLQSAATGQAMQGQGGMGMSNPYLSSQANAIQQVLQRNLGDSMALINQQGTASGQYGGARQGVAQGRAIGDSQLALGSALANLYSGGYTADQNFGLGLGNLLNQRQSINNQYDLGLGGLNNQATLNTQNFYTAQRGQDLNQYALGANMFNQGLQGQIGIGQGIYGLGQTAQQAPWTQINNANAGLGQWSGYGTTTTAQGQNNTLGNALGGALGGAQLGNLWRGVNNNNSWMPTNSGLDTSGNSQATQNAVALGQSQGWF